MSSESISNDCCIQANQNYAITTYVADMADQLSAMALSAGLIRLSAMLESAAEESRLAHADAMKAGFAALGRKHCSD